MDFELSDLERELATQVAAMAAGRFPLSSSRAAESQRDVVDPDAWQALIDVGVFSLLVPEDEGGLGLGLAISYKIVQLHGGRIDVQSRLSSGTKFTVWLPLTPPAAAQSA